jgi:hypothetical protein
VRIIVATVIALVIAIPLDLTIEGFARRAFAVSPDFEPFQGTVGPYAAGGVILAGVVFGVLRRIVRDADRLFVRLAVTALVLSWIPDGALLVIHDPGATASAVGSLMVMHAVTAAIVVTLLVWIARPSSASA